MKKFIKWLEGWLPTLWALLWTAIITVGSIALLITVVKWLMNLLEVM